MCNRPQSRLVCWYMTSMLKELSSHGLWPGPADIAKMRLAASEALLRLARMHDLRIYPEVYLALALAMQACTSVTFGSPCVSRQKLSQI